jgi:hypothetical protein
LLGVIGLASLVLLGLFWSAFNEPIAVHPIYRQIEGSSPRVGPLASNDSNTHSAAA